MTSDERKTLEALADAAETVADVIAREDPKRMAVSEAVRDSMVAEDRAEAAAIRAALATVDALTQQVADLAARAIPPEWVESLDNRTLWVSLESPGDGTRDVCVRYHDGVATIERVVGTDRMFLETRMPLSAALSAATEAP